MLDVKKTLIKLLNRTNTIEILPITHTSNPYVGATELARANAYRKNGVLFFNGNLSFASSGGPSTALPDFLEIGRITGWNAYVNVLQSVPTQNYAGQSVTVQITSAGVIRIYTATGANGGWFRFFVAVPTVRGGNFPFIRLVDGLPRGWALC